MKFNKVVSVLASAVMAASLFAAPAFAGETEASTEAGTEAEGDLIGAKGTQYKIAVVPKMTNIAWFQRMQDGVDEYNKETGSNVVYGGSAEGADQASYVEGLLAEDWDAICVVPFDSEALAPVLQKARDQGIKVITHEAASMDASVRDIDVEAFQNAAYGENFMKELGELTGGKGKYIQFVGALTSVSHNEWCDAAKALQEKEYPDMECVGRYETGDDTTSSYNQTKELLTANPDITAIEGSASTDVVGAAQAVEELGLAGKVAIVGTSMTSIAQQYVEDGTIASFSVWDPAEAGKAMICMAIAELDGTVDESTMHLAAKGYETVENVNKDGVYYGSARVDVTKDNMNDYNF
ncbi:MAG TPA: LacI family transcriptional regulator [Lachnospiraceae bacterium]|jgi:simple sugar transport system substrate-binding protein|nr:LacI family transcriptional regulator [Lachnospiraceae bacterium]